MYAHYTSLASYWRQESDRMQILDIYNTPFGSRLKAIFTTVAVGIICVVLHAWKFLSKHCCVCKGKTYFNLCEDIGMQGCVGAKSWLLFILMAKRTWSHSISAPYIYINICILVVTFLRVVTNDTAESQTAVWCVWRTKVGSGLCRKQKAIRRGTYQWASTARASSNDAERRRVRKGRSVLTCDQNGVRLKGQGRPIPAPAKQPETRQGAHIKTQHKGLDFFETKKKTTQYANMSVHE